MPRARVGPTPRVSNSGSRNRRRGREEVIAICCFILGTRRGTLSAVTQSRFIRDPIHGDVRLDPIESAIVDSRIFQRLRYIRQNGLLHLVFPGAVHTRFAHSLGTMDIARRVEASLFGPHPSQPARYLGQVFRLAALLHDVGHGAFSHSIEHVTRADGSPFLGTTRSLYEKWGYTQLLNVYLNEHADGDEPVTHEQIGLILVAELFILPSVVRACEEATWGADQLGQDVQAIMNGRLPVSEHFKQCATELVETIRPGCDSASVAAILHNLVSGTLDVDRLDYLIRDSFHCGVPYGTCEVDLLIKSLSLGEFDDQLVLRLDRKAAHALDDMLWSRYQLFLQVLNHKTNVGLNAAFGEAIGEALRAGHLQTPKSMANYVAMIDDAVIGKMFDLAQMEDTDDDRPFIKIFVDRRVPRHLKAYRLQPDEDLGQMREKLKNDLAEEHKMAPSAIIVGVAKSELIKDASPLPLIWDRRTNTTKKFESDTSVPGLGSEKYRVLHFFTTRS